MPSLTFLQLPFLHALGWSLLHFLWQASLVALLLRILFALVPSQHARFRHAAACLAMLTLLLLPVVTCIKLALSQPTPTRFPSSLTVSQALAPIWSVNADHLTGSWLEQATLRLDHALPAILSLWLTGVLLLSIRLQIGLSTARKMKRQTTPILPDHLAISFPDLMHKLRITQAVVLAQSAWVEVPTVIGWLRPVILLPIGCLSGLTPLQLEALLAHELAHIRRHDYLFSVLQAIAEALLFYHPATWWISNQIRIEREHCCDDIAAAACGNRLAYAKTLSLLETQRSAQPAFGLGAHSGSLLKRIKRLLNTNNTPSFAPARAIALTAVACTVAFAAPFVAGSFLLTAQAQTHQSLPAILAAAVNPPAQERPATPTHSSDPYQTWVEEDVRWIIAPEERTAYLALRTNDERDHFIQQFWERRNPNPGSPENLFRIEHYRRIAYANAHFAGPTPGWASNRGQIYIQHGPPDSIDAHPTGAAGAPQPFELWHYRSIQLRTTHDPQAAAASTKTNVDFHFVDTCSCGNYQLQP